MTFQSAEYFLRGFWETITPIYEAVLEEIEEMYFDAVECTCFEHNKNIFSI